MQKNGFSLVELLTTLAILSLVAGSMIVVMNNLNAQSERMNTQTQMLVGGADIIDMIRPWAALAGLRQRPAAMNTNQAFQILDAGNRVKFCFDLDDANRSKIEFRLNDRRLQQRRRDNKGCSAPSDNNFWEDISEPIIDDINFSSETTGTLDVKLELEKFNPGSQQPTSVTLRQRLPLTALQGL